MIKSLKLFTLCVVMLSLPSLAFAAKTHRVKKHETLYTLAKKYNVTVEELKSANNLVGSTVKPRQLLVIPPRSLSEGKPAQTARTTKVYKAKKGESLARIAKKTGVSVAELKRLNGLAGSKVKKAKVLVLRESVPAADEPKVKVAQKVQLRHPDLFNDKDYEQSLQELAALEPDNQVDLSKNTDLKVDNIKELKKSAYGFLGTRYRFGGTSRSGIDCSSFVQHVFKDLEIALPRTAREQFEIGTAVAPGDLRKGDLIFFATYASYPSHVGIYLGNNKMIHASSHDRRVVISSLNSAYYRTRFLGAKRIAKVNPDVFRLDDLILGVEEDNSDSAMEEDGLSSSN